MRPAHTTGGLFRETLLVAVTNLLVLHDMTFFALLFPFFQRHFLGAQIIVAALSGIEHASSLGLVVMSPELEEVADGILTDKTPSVPWQRNGKEQEECAKF